jgi:GAF domain-containing protein
VPIKISGAKVGKLYFEGDQDWSEDDLEVVESVTRQVAQQIENLRLLAQAEQYQAEAQEALQRLTRKGWQRYHDQLESDGVGYVYQNQQVKPITKSDPEYENMLSYPISVRDEHIGQIDIIGIEKLPEDDIELVNYINEQLGEHLENIRLSDQTQLALAETEDQSKRLSALNELSEQITTAQDFKQILDTIAFYLDQIVPTNHSSITWPTQDGKSLEVYTLQDDSGAIPTGSYLSKDGTAVGTVFTERRVIIIPDLAKSDFVENTQLIEKGLRSSMSVPLLTTDRTLGTLNFSSQGLDAFGDRQRDLAIQVASLISNVIENRNLFQQTQVRAEREQTLREITTNMRTFVEPELILRTAVRELGETLGRNVFIQLETIHQDEEISDKNQVEEPVPSQEN